MSRNVLKTDLVRRLTARVLSPRDIAVLVLALLGALVPFPSRLVERSYSMAIYPPVQQIVTAASNRVPFAVLDLLLAGVAVAWVGICVRDAVARGIVAAAARAAARTAVWAAALYLVFLAAWGLNYRRLPLQAKLETDPSGLQPDAARRIGRLTVDRVDALYAASARARTDRGPDAQLADGLAAAVADLRLRPPVVGRPKSTIMDFYFERAGVDGMTDPFFLETLVADDVLPFERPFVVAHEWSHLAGVADEGDANFVGWLACLHGSAADQYSGWLFLYMELTRAVGRSDRAALQERLDVGPRDDLRAIRDRLARHVSPRVSLAGWRLYDSYLKANRIEAGSASYAGVVRLVLTTQFRADWRPVLKP